MTTTPTVPCRLCSEPTTMLGTRLCHRCWELEHRIQADPDLARKTIADLDKIGPFLYIEVDDGGASGLEISTIHDLSHRIRGWMEPYNKDSDEAALAWMSTAKPGDWHEYRMGWFFRVNEVIE
jgi:hypothetical protein